MLYEILSTVQCSTYVSTRNCDLRGKSLRFIAVYRIIPIECLILFFRFKFVICSSVIYLMYKIWFSHGGECEDYRLLGCDAIKKVYVLPLPTGSLAVLFFFSLCH